ncbi:MAG TPA: HAD family phosphatase [Spirochaetia bacterium]|nr:HAD family phosphatase [Spirochaetia bacterium]
MFPKALILDLDGTLADTEPLHDRAWEGVLHGVPPEALAVERQKWVGMASTDIARELIARFHLSQSVEDMLREKRRRFRQLVRQGLEPFPGLADELAWWNDVPLAVATSGSRREALLMLETLRLPVDFEAVVTSDDVPLAKPAPDCYLLAAELLGKSPWECVAIEDSTNGMVAAVAAGMRVIGVSAVPAKSLPAGIERVFSSTVEALRWLRDGAGTF